MNVLLFKPAYGRIYVDAAQLVAAWERGEDFLILNGGPYTSIRDLPTLRTYDLPMRLVCGTTFVEIT